MIWFSDWTNPNHFLSPLALRASNKMSKRFRSLNSMTTIFGRSWRRPLYCSAQKKHCCRHATANLKKLPNSLSATMWWSRFASEVILPSTNRILFRIWTIYCNSAKVSRRMQTHCQNCKWQLQCHRWMRPLSTWIWCRTAATWVITKLFWWTWIGSFIWMRLLCRHWICYQNRAHRSARQHTNAKVFWVCWIDAKRLKAIDWWHSGSRWAEAIESR